MLINPYRQQLFDHIKENALRKDIYLDMINGYTDHVHCLVWLSAGQTVDGVAHLLKGESAYWFNNHSGIVHEKLKWQDHYFAASVGLSALEKVRTYIANQEAHHAKTSFANEYEEMMKQFLVTKDLENSLAHFKFRTRR